MQSLMGAATGVEIVPAHTYARLRFDDAADQAVQHLALVLQSHRGSPYEGQFVSQAEPRAGTSLRHFPADPAQHGAPLGKKTLRARSWPLRASRIGPVGISSPANRFHHCCSMELRGLRRVSRALKSPAPPDLHTRAHPIAPTSPNPRHGLLPSAHRPALGARGNGYDWQADYGRDELRRDSVRPGPWKASSPLQVSRRASQITGRTIPPILADGPPNPALFLANLPPDPADLP